MTFKRKVLGIIALIAIIGLVALFYAGCVAPGDDPVDPIPVDPIPEWAEATSPFTSVNTITYGAGKFVAGGNSGIIAYSTDGATWETADVASIFGTAEQIYSIVYGEDKFVAGGKGIIAYSSDGVTWTAVEDDNIESIFGGDYPTSIKLYYGNNKYFALSNGGSSSISEDGLTWSENINLKVSVNALVYGNGKYVAVGGNWYGTADADRGKKIMISDDGETWEQVDVGSIFGTDNYVNSIAFGGGKFIASSTGSSKTATSTDGKTWTVITTPFYGNITYGNGKFYLSGITITGAGTPDVAVIVKIATSTDGTAWTTDELTMLGLTSPIVASGGGKVVVAGLTNGKLAYLSEN